MTPDFEPGDIIEFQHGEKRLVRNSRTEFVHKQWETVERLVVVIDGPEPVEEIVWPERGARVYRNGQLIHTEPV